MKKIVIAIDGYSSCGKSTLALQLAQELDYIFVDSGAMYRAITLYFLQHQINVEDPIQVNKALEQIHLKFVYDSIQKKSFIHLNNTNVEQKIREKIINDNVSIVAANKAVREFAIAQQQLMGDEKGIVMDGRDIGTTVFPNAELKIFVTADVDVRTERRYKELQEKGIASTKEEVKQNLQQRDFIDSNRDFSPLKQADDAVVLDNSRITKQEQFKLVLDWANKKING
ncbi:MAG: (d)CMP kinase [Chitinophagaceae bacterium]|nr:(d)CMP kinase [Chitinophagaceae bacterium]